MGSLIALFVPYIRLRPKAKRVGSNIDYFFIVIADSCDARSGRNRDADGESVRTSHCRYPSSVVVHDHVVFGDRTSRPAA